MPIRNVGPSSRAACLALSLSFAATLTGAADAPPVTAVKPITDTYFGTPFTDNYRYLENLQDPLVQGWMRAQAGYTRAVLDKLPSRGALLERIHALANADTQRGGFILRGQRYFYELVEPGAQQPKLMYRDGLKGEERLLIDPAKLATDPATHYALDYYTPSWDGRLVAYGLSAGGSEASTLHLIEVESGKVLDESITRTNNSVIAWRQDNHSFYYLRYAQPTPQTPAAETMYNARTYLHAVGVHPDGDQDAVVFGRGVAKAVEVPDGQGTYLVGSAQSPYFVAVANHNMDAAPATLHVAPTAKINGAATPWRKLASVGDGVTQFMLHGDTLYFLSQRGAPHFQILATSLAQPDVLHPRVVVAEGKAVITDFDLASDGLYYRERDGAVSRLMRSSLDGAHREAVPLPFEGNLYGPVTDPSRPGALFDMQGWTQPAQLYAYDPSSNSTINTGLLPASSIDTSQLESQEVMVTSYDGTRVPLSILYRKGTRLDGSHPAIIEGYGSYGVVVDAGFRPSSVAWIERGGIWAIAHVRGGGELGEDWHRGGMMRTKPNTVLDFIACSQYLIDQGYTSAALLGATGGSAGGITVGGAMTMRPDLYRVILDEVGMSDALRMETEPNGPPNTPEFGSVSTEEGFHGLYAMSTYAHVHDGVAYPAVMFVTGANDPRVAPWHMMKMAARVQAATNSGRPVLLRIDYDAGHGFGSNRSQREQLRADMWAFALWQMGDPAFQPAASQ
ncbi:MAG TPA: prolyl oligopeptidase family serine peptidase [Steroidobacteraceae bacterium]|nr:prolyl oligopeptidase family serine peptidase [Steroidobacteraceae bacterium]